MWYTNLCKSVVVSVGLLVCLQPFLLKMEWLDLTALTALAKSVGDVEAETASPVPEADDWVDIDALAAVAGPRRKLRNNLPGTVPAIKHASTMRFKKLKLKKKKLAPHVQDRWSQYIAFVPSLCMLLPLAQYFPTT